MNYSENQIIKQAQKGDSRAFETLVTKYDSNVLSIAASFRNNIEDAKDIYQEVFMRVHKGLKNFRFQSEFSTWLYRITTNVCISFDRKKKNRNIDSLNRHINENNEDEFIDLIESDSKTDEKVIQNETERELFSAVNTLPVKQKLAFSLKYIEGYKIREIAVMMDCKEGTIKRYLFDASEKLRKKLSYLID